MPSRATILRSATPAALLALAACEASHAPADTAAVPRSDETAATATASQAGAAPGDSGDTHAYTGIAAAETVRFTGTEPFWGGQVAGATLTYSTPDKPDGEAIPVTRFAGRNGVSWSGTWQGAPFRLAVSEATCSDGMSDRSYPFTATLAVQGEQRQGCAWTDRRPAIMPEGTAAP